MTHYRRGDPETGCALIGLVLGGASVAMYVAAWFVAGWPGIVLLALISSLLLGAIGIALGLTMPPVPPE